MTYSEQCERDEINRLCDMVQYRCVYSDLDKPHYDMHGLPITEMIETKQVQTGVICRNCQAKPVRIEDLR